MKRAACISSQRRLSRQRMIAPVICFWDWFLGRYSLAYSMTVCSGVPHCHLLALHCTTRIVSYRCLSRKPTAQCNCLTSPSLGCADNADYAEECSKAGDGLSQAHAWQADSEVAGLLGGRQGLPHPAVQSSECAQGDA
jgi:hypothetical protein